MQITRESVAGWLIPYLSRKLDIPEKQIFNESMLMEDLGMDELDILELPGDIGDEFDLLMPSCSECRTVGDVVNLVVLTAMGKKPSDIADATAMAMAWIENKPEDNDGEKQVAFIPVDNAGGEVRAVCAFCDGGVPLERASFPVCDSCRKILTEIIAERKGMAK